MASSDKRAGAAAPASGDSAPWYDVPPMAGGDEEMAAPAGVDTEPKSPASSSPKPPAGAPADGLKAVPPRGWGSVQPPDTGRWAYIAFHPHARIFLAVSLTFCNFLLYGEDPIVHSYTEAEVPVFGHAWALVALRYPSSGWVVLVKVAAWVVCGAIGFVVGRLAIHHMLLRDVAGLTCFGWRHIDDDDIRAATLYNPFKGPHTPYNMAWWWGRGSQASAAFFPPEYLEKAEDTSEEKEVKQRLQEAYRTGAASAKKQGVATHILTAAVGEAEEGVFAVQLKPHEPDWTREEYQAEQQTIMEMYFPRLFHPRKHADATKGSVITTGFVMCLFLTLGALIYNKTVLKAHYGDGPDYKAKVIDAGVGLAEWEFGKFAAIFCWLADLLNLLVAVDCILQEVGTHHTALAAAGIPYADVAAVVALDPYNRPGLLLAAPQGTGDDELRKVARLLKDPTPRFKVGYLRHFNHAAWVWNYRVPLPCTADSSIAARVLIVWAVFVGCTSIVFASVVGDAVSWDKWTEKAGVNAGTTELWRVAIASLIAIQGPMTVAMDWEWPSFSGESDLKLPGFDTNKMTCATCCNVCACEAAQHDRDGRLLPQRKLPCVRFHVTNKWLAFLPFFISLCLDFAMLYSSWEYTPALYGQYTNPSTHEICTIRNTTYAEEVKREWERVGVSIVNFTQRVDEGFLILDSYDGEDFCIPARFIGTSSGLKMLAALPGFCAYVYIFIYFVRYVKIERELKAWESLRDDRGDTTS